MHIVPVEHLLCHSIIELVFILSLSTEVAAGWAKFLLFCLCPEGFSLNCILAAKFSLTMHNSRRVVLVVVVCWRAFNRHYTLLHLITA